jgi:hypothetical protein
MDSLKAFACNFSIEAPPTDRWLIGTIRQPPAATASQEITAPLADALPIFYNASREK